MLSREKIYPVFSLIALVLYIYGLKEFNPLLNQNRIFDYLVWFSTIASLYAGYLDLRKHYRVSIFSSVGIEVVGLILVVMGRLLSLYYNELPCLSFGYLAPIIGTYYTVEGLVFSILVFVGSILIFLSNITHSLYAPLIIYQNGASLQDLTDLVRSKALSIIETRSGVLLLCILVFTLSFLFRFGVELIYWPQLIGWDTPEYVAHLMDFSARISPFTSYYWMGHMRNIPPLLDIILLPFGLTGNAWLAFKVFPSLCFALINVLSSLIVVYVYKKSWYVGFLAGLTTTMYILNLRISWDYQKQLLGTLFLLVGLLLLEKWDINLSLKKSIIVLLVLVCMVLSTEITGLASFGVSLYLFWKAFKSRRQNMNAVIVGIIGAVVSIMLEIWYWKRPYTITTVGVAPVGIVSYGPNQFDQVVSYLIAGYGIILPLSLYTLIRYNKPYIRLVFALFFLAGISPLIAPYTSVITWYRFLIQLAPIVTFLASIAIIETLKKPSLILFFLIVFSLPGIGFAYAHNLVGLYTRSLREFPSALIPVPSYIDVYEYFKDNPPQYPVIAFANAAKYVHMAIRNPTPDQLIWVKQINNKTICEAITKYDIKQDHVIIVTLSNLTQISISCAENVTLLKKLSANIYLAKTR